MGSIGFCERMHSISFYGTMVELIKTSPQPSWVFALSKSCEEEGLEVNSWIRRGIGWTCRKAPKPVDFRRFCPGPWPDAADAAASAASGWEKALFQCWETLMDPLRLGFASDVSYTFRDLLGMGGHHF